MIVKRKGILRNDCSIRIRCNWSQKESCRGNIEIWKKLHQTKKKDRWRLKGSYFKN